MLQTPRLDLHIVCVNAGIFKYIEQVRGCEFSQDISDFVLSFCRKPHSG